MSASILFDVDSTLLDRESFEELIRLATPDPAVLEQVALLSRLAMEGTISFQESLSKRIALSAFTRQHVAQICHQLADWISPGMKELIAKLQAQSIRVWLVSGGLQEIITHCALLLKIPKEQAQGAKVGWSEDDMPIFDWQDALSQSKVLGAQALAAQFTSPTIMIGDGWTDFEVFSKGVANYFVAYTQWVKRPQVIAAAQAHNQNIAQNSQELEAILDRLVFGAFAPATS